MVVMTFNEWFMSLPEGRQKVLREDKWVLANAAFEAGARLSREEMSGHGKPMFDIDYN